jgi:hypothetical protein
VFHDSDISLGDSLSYQVLIEGGILHGVISNRELFLNSVNDSNGVASVIVTATDMSSASVSDTFDVTIVPVNDSPTVFSLLEPQDQGTLTSVDTISFVWSESIDIDGDPLFYSLNLFGPSVDTTVTHIADTTLEFISHGIMLDDTTYHWTMSVTDGIDTVACADTFAFTTPAVTTIDRDLVQVPLTYALRQNYPNPFNPSTTINFDIPHAGYVNLKIFNVLGEEVATLVNENFSPGKYQYLWKADGLASGLYFYRMEAEGFVETRKMFLMK